MADLRAIEPRTERDSMVNEASVADHSRAILNDAHLARLTLPELQEYFAECLAACDLDVRAPRLPPKAYDNVPKGHKVYFLQGAGGAIKIGFTAQSMAKRLHCIQNGSPVKIEVLAVRNAPRDCEQAYHRVFAAHRLHGEWFAPHPNILAEIERVRNHP